VELATGGEVVKVRTPDLMVGYVDDDGNGFTAPLEDGWFDTGDRGVVEDGALRITGREKELIIRGGINLSPREIELALEGAPGVNDVAVVGVPHPVLGEDVAAVVVCRHGITLAEVEAAMRELAMERLDNAQRPSVYLQIDELPRTTTGKVRSQRLRDLVVDRLGLAPQAPA
jgi:acyl-CoA synthetase (AMP-forming)/AMP-acid ligase II